jgi:hypothetical protein
VARDVLIVVSGAVLSAGTGLLVGRLWVLMRRRGHQQPAGEQPPDLVETLEREAAASGRAAEDVEAHLSGRTLEPEA